MLEIKKKRGKCRLLVEVGDKRLGDDAREGVSSGVTWFQVRFLRCFDLSEQRLLFRHISWHGKKGMR